jgi:DNA excision repair protein ERCC-2
MLRTYSDEFPLFLKGKEVFIEPNITSEATIALNRFLSLPRQGKSGILFGVCGGKWSEGLDYRGELLNGAMVIGLPLAPFNPVRRMVIDYFRKKFGPNGEFISYTLPAMNRALQALGRVLRTPKDTGVLVLGDARFLEARVRQGLPVWMQEEMMPCTVDEFTEEIRAWR